MARNMRGSHLHVLIRFGKNGDRAHDPNVFLVKV